MKGMINFDSTDWNSIQDTINKINEIGCIQLGTTSNGEDILFDVANFGAGDCLVTEVFQENGYIRKTIYHPDDWTVETSYRKEN